MPTGSARRAPPWRRRPRAAGFGYLGLIWGLAMLSAGLAFIGESWTLAAQRERERELVFRGEQIREAIERYRRAVPTDTAWPKTVDELLEDRRGDGVRHHLRRRFEDPAGGSAGWAEIREAAGGLIGVHSRSTALALGRWPRDVGTSGRRQRLAEWRFVAAEGVPVPPVAEARGGVPDAAPNPVGRP